MIFHGPGPWQNQLEFCRLKREICNSRAYPHWLCLLSSSTTRLATVCCLGRAASANFAVIDRKTGPSAAVLPKVTQARVMSHGPGAPQDRLEFWGSKPQFSCSSALARPILCSAGRFPAVFLVRQIRKSQFCRFLPQKRAASVPQLYQAMPGAESRVMFHLKMGTDFCRPMFLIEVLRMRQSWGSGDPYAGKLNRNGPEALLLFALSRITRERAQARRRRALNFLLLLWTLCISVGPEHTLERFRGGHVIKVSCSEQDITDCSLLAGNYGAGGKSVSDGASSSTNSVCALSKAASAVALIHL